jgi:hypothetical protein
MIAWLLGAELIALLLNMTGDCRPEVSNCGETARLISFGVLAIGAVGAAITIARHIFRRRA